MLDKHAIAFLKDLAENTRIEIDAIERTIELIETRMSAPQSVEAPYMPDSVAERPVLSPAKWKRGVLTPVETFDPFGKLDRKIAYALTRLETGDRDAILNEIHQAQPDRDKYKLENALAVRLNYLLKNGFIRADKYGRKYQYQLVKAG
ncbi:soluble adenylyl cyclase-like protein [Olivibacter sp. XZL3]|uniref:soluble adenylyl cyclase-like protein n=1 Tax=Olivibacter sp. XZL3 TaxID=1735116 RepID=UPI001416FB75|nr:soluble adenylyl cyclase-like protein [Olivibacter sp. XZL3]